MRTRIAGTVVGVVLDVVLEVVKGVRFEGGMFPFEILFCRLCCRA